MPKLRFRRWLKWLVCNYRNKPAINNCTLKDIKTGVMGKTNSQSGSWKLTVFTSWFAGEGTAPYDRSPLLPPSTLSRFCPFHIFSFTQMKSKYAPIKHYTDTHRDDLLMTLMHRPQAITRNHFLNNTHYAHPKTIRSFSVYRVKGHITSSLKKTLKIYEFFITERTSEVEKKLTLQCKERKLTAG